MVAASPQFANPNLVMVWVFHLGADADGVGELIEYDMSSVCTNSARVMDEKHVFAPGARGRKYVGEM